MKHMTPYDVALRMTRQRGTTVSDPEFIEVYLQAEFEKDPIGMEMLLFSKAWVTVKGQLRAFHTEALKLSRMFARQDLMKYIYEMRSTEFINPA